MWEQGDEEQNSEIRTTMTGVSLDLRTQSYGSPQQPQNGSLQIQNGFIVRKSSRMSLSGSREKDKLLLVLCRYLSRKKVVMLILVSFALMAFLSGFFTTNRGSYPNFNHICFSFDLPIQ